MAILSGVLRHVNASGIVNVNKAEASEEDVIVSETKMLECERTEQRSNCFKHSMPKLPQSQLSLKSCVNETKIDEFLRHFASMPRRFGSPFP